MPKCPSIENEIHTYRVSEWKDRYRHERLKQFDQKLLRKTNTDLRHKKTVQLRTITAKGVGTIAVQSAPKICIVGGLDIKVKHVVKRIGWKY